MAEVRASMDHDDVVDNIKGIWRDIDDLKPEDVPLIGMEEVRALMTEFLSRDVEEQVFVIASLLFLDSLTDRKRLKSLYRALEVEFNDDEWGTHDGFWKAFFGTHSTED